MTRARITKYVKVDQGDGNPIDLSVEIKGFNWIIKKILINWGVTPATSENLLIKATQPNQHTKILFDFDPSECDIKDWLMTDPIELDRVDLLNISYSNSDDQDVGVELILEQV